MRRLAPFTPPGTIPGNYHRWALSIGIRSEHKLFLSCRASRASDGGHRISRPGGPARCVCLNQLGQGGRSARGAERGSPVVFFFFPQPRLFIFWRGAMLSGWHRAGDRWVWAPFKGLPCTLDFWRYSRRSGKGKRCVTLGLPGHGCILLITLGVGGIICDLADAGVSQVVLTRLNLAQGNCHRD